MDLYDRAKKWWFGSQDPTQPPTLTKPTDPTANTPAIVLPTTKPSSPDADKITIPLKPLVSNQERARIFGEFAYEAQSLPGNEEHIRVLGSWAKDNIKWVVIPQLRGIRGVENQKPVGNIPGLPPGMYFHRKAERQLQEMFAHWERAGLLHLLLSFEGSYAPRFVRGSSSTLSNHAFGNAFDCNYDWNHLGAPPAGAGHTGSVVPLVPIASQHGFFWGGNYSGRKDGMHFEVAKILP